MKKSLIVLKMMPVQTLVLGYLLITVAGAVLLSLPASSSQGTGQPLVDALFVSASGISTTGLTVVNVSSYYSVFGQVVLMTLFQIGGLGYMAFFMFLISLLNKGVSLKNRMVAVESVSGTDKIRIFSFFQAMIIFTLVFELAGAVSLFFSWKSLFPLTRRIYLSVFHAVSAFCTAGFSLFPDSLVSFRNNIPVNMTISLLSLMGGVGFIVLYDTYFYLGNLFQHRRPRRLSVHTKLVLLFTAAIIGICTVFVVLAEIPPLTRFADKPMPAVFQVISASTTDGFNTVDIGSMSVPGLLVLLALMFVGAGPGSTGGGIKISTFAILIVSTFAVLRGKREVNFSGRKISEETIRKAFTIFFLFVGLYGLGILLLSGTEKGTFLQVAFEIASALGNTGLSTGITPDLTVVGKVFLIITMFAGRVGPLTLGVSLLSKPERSRIQYAEADIYVG